MPLYIHYSINMPFCKVTVHVGGRLILYEIKHRYFFKRIKQRVVGVAGFSYANINSNGTPPIKPKTNIKISGNNRVKITDEGLRTIDLKLAFAIASVALKLLYGFGWFISYF